MNEHDRQTRISRVREALRRVRTEGAAAAHDVRPLLAELDRSPAPVPCIRGVRIVRLEVSQLFRIPELLLQTPAHALARALTVPAALRRAVRSDRPLALSGVGRMRFARWAGSELRDFWDVLTPGFDPSDTPLGFVPFELAPLPGFEPGVLEEALNTQVRSRLRIYAPGVGIVRLSITLEFREDVEVEQLARIARDVEGMMFGARACDAVFADAVEATVRGLFGSDVAPQERRWRPPETMFVLYGEEAFDPAESIDALAQLAALAPGNQEPRVVLRQRLRRVLATREWSLSGLSAFASERASLILMSRAARASARRRADLDRLLETHDAITAAVHVQQLFEERLGAIVAANLLDATWHPGSEKFATLVALVRALKQAMQAIVALELRFQTYRAGPLIQFARALWRTKSTSPADSLERNLERVSAFVGSWPVSDATVAMQALLSEVAELPPPFRSRPARLGAESEVSVASVERVLEAYLRELER